MELSAASLILWNPAPGPRRLRRRRGWGPPADEGMREGRSPRRRQPHTLLYTLRIWLFKTFVMTFYTISLGAQRFCNCLQLQMLWAERPCQGTKLFVPNYTNSFVHGLEGCKKGPYKFESTFFEGRACLLLLTPWCQDFSTSAQPPKSGNSRLICVHDMRNQYLCRRFEW